MHGSHIYFNQDLPIVKTENAFHSDYQNPVRFNISGHFETYGWNWISRRVTELVTVSSKFKLPIQIYE